MADDDFPFFYVTPVDSNIGRRVESVFVLKLLLGRGGMGGAYLAEHLGLPDVKCVIKLILAHLTAEPTAIGRFRTEAGVGQKLTHRHIAKLHSAGTLEDTGQWYLRFEYVNGTTLGRHVAERGGRLSLHDAAYILFQVCVACDYMHARKVVHRDLKPDNVLIVIDVDAGEEISPFVKIIDFGISKLLGSDDQTGSGINMGTPTYMAPEQVSDAASAGPASDMFAVGVMAYELLTGALPWGPVENATGLYFKQRTESPVPPPEHLVPPELWNLFQGCLSLIPEKRPGPRAFALALACLIPATDSKPNGTQLLREVKKSWVDLSPTYAQTLPTNVEALRWLPEAQPPLGHDGRLPPLLDVVTVPPIPVPPAPVPEVTVPPAPVPEVTVPEVTVPEVTVPPAPVPEVTVPEVTAPEIPAPEVPAPQVPVPEDLPAEQTPVATAKGRRRGSPAAAGTATDSPSSVANTATQLEHVPVASAQHPRALPVLPAGVLAAFSTGLDSQKIVASVEVARAPAAREQLAVASEIQLRAIGTPGPQAYAHANVPRVVLSTTQLSGVQTSAPPTPPPKPSAPAESSTPSQPNAPMPEPSERLQTSAAMLRPPQGSAATLGPSGTTAQPSEPPQARAATLRLSGTTAEPSEPPQARAATLRLSGTTVEPTDSLQAPASTLQLTAVTAAHATPPAPQPHQVRPEPPPFIVLPQGSRPSAPRRRLVLLAAVAGALVTVVTIVIVRYVHAPSGAGNGDGGSAHNHTQTKDATVAILEVPRQAAIHLAAADAGVPPVVDAMIEGRLPTTWPSRAEPAAMKPEPPDAKPEPPATKPEPPATKPEPSATKPEPSATKPEPSATKPEPSATKPARGRLSVHVDPFADVWIDGRFVKTTPIENMSLSVGRHRVRLVNEPGERDETVTITIDPAKPILIEKNW